MDFSKEDLTEGVSIFNNIAYSLYCIQMHDNNISLLGLVLQQYSTVSTVSVTIIVSIHPIH